MEQSPSTPQATHHQQPSPQNLRPPMAATSTSVPPTPSSLQLSATTSSFPSLTSNLLPAPEPLASLQPQQSSTSQARPAFDTRSWPQKPSYSHFFRPSPPNPASSAPATSPASAPPTSRGGVAIGVPAGIPTTAIPPPASFSSLTLPSYDQQSQNRQSMQGMRITGTVDTASSMPHSHWLRPPTPTLRPQITSSSPSPSGQNFQGYIMHSTPSLGSPWSSPPPRSSQTRAQTRPWLTPITQGKPPLQTPILWSQATPRSFQPRSITQQLQHKLPIIPHQQPISSNEQSFCHQQQVTKGPGSGSQRPALGLIQSGMLHSEAPSKTSSVDINESFNRIMSKRSIQELVNQIDPSEKLDTEVEDILVEIAEDFVESITTFGCSLAKHRKSTTLQAKDIMLHLERNWNMTFPVFGGDKIKMYKKPTTSEFDRERLAAVKKSILTAEMMGKTSAGLTVSNSKIHLAKGPDLLRMLVLPSNPKISEET